MPAPRSISSAERPTHAHTPASKARALRPNNPCLDQHAPKLTSSVCCHGNDAKHTVPSYPNSVCCSSADEDVTDDDVDDGATGASADAVVF